MTVGSRVLNGQYTAVFPVAPWLPNGGSMLVGRYFSKDWSGADSSVSERAVRIKSRPRTNAKQQAPTPPLKKTRLTKLQRLALKRKVKKFGPQTDSGSGYLAYKESMQEYDAETVAIRNENLNRYKRQPLKRALAPHSYTMTLIDYTYGAYAVCKDSDGLYRNFTRFEPYVNSHIDVKSQDFYKVIDKLRARVYGSGFHPGIFAAESPKALKMIANAATQLRNGLVAARKGDWRGVVRNLGTPQPSDKAKAREALLSYNEGRKTLSQFWLALQYGWKPLIKDLEDGADYLAQAMYQPVSALDTRVAAKRDGQYVVTDVNPTLFTCGSMRRTTKYRLKYVITNLKAAPLMQPGWASSASVAWEIVPYSFVVDWVAPIGAYLQAMRTANDLKGTVVMSLLQETTWDRPGMGSACKGYKLLTVVPSSFRKVTFTRTVSAELIPPTPLGNLSPSSVISVWQRAANAVALLQALKFDENDLSGVKKLFSRPR